MSTHAALRIDNLKFRYHRRRKSEPWVIDIPSLELARGEQMLLTGSSGRGKSTLLHLISGIMDPVEGETYVDGQAMHGLHGAARDLFRGKRIGIIFQNFNLLSGFSALDNVMTAMMFSTIPRSKHRKRARDLLHHLGILHPRKHPDKLSIGQQQRIAVARAVACDPVLVLADEPTASLDPDNANTAMQLIQNICREKNAALLCVSHDPTMHTRFQRKASLDELSKGVGGRIQAESKPAEQALHRREKMTGEKTVFDLGGGKDADLELNLEGSIIEATEGGSDDTSIPDESGMVDHKE